jgi:hypothetical protein
VGNSDHNILSVEIDAEKASSSEFDIEAADSATCFEEVPGVDKKMKGYQITMKQAFDNIKPLSISDEMCATRKR